MLAYLLALSIVCSPASNKLEEAVESFVNINYPIEQAQYQFDYRRVNWNLIPIEFDSLRVIKIAKDSPLGYTIFTLGIYDNNKLKKAVPVSIGVTLLIDALVTNMPINGGEKIEGLRLEKRSITGKGEWPVTDSLLFEGMQSKSYIKAGSVIYMSMLEPVPVINPGDNVEIIYESAGLKITTSGVARQKGGIGDIIKVSNIESRKIIEAEIVDSLTVALK